jgi:hypothetical protein
LRFLILTLQCLKGRPKILIHPRDGLSVDVLNDDTNSLLRSYRQRVRKGRKKRPSLEKWMSVAASRQPGIQ